MKLGKYLGAVNPLGRPIGGKSTDVFVGALVGLLISGLTKRFVVDNVFKDPTSSIKQGLDNYWPVVGAVLAGALLGTVGKKVPGLNRMNQNALAAGAVTAAAAPFVYAMVASKVPVPGLSDTVEVALQGYNGVIVRDGAMNGLGLMAADNTPRFAGTSFADLAAMSMADEDEDGLADLVAVNF